jgi:hypothetical protein
VIFLLAGLPSWPLATIVPVVVRAAAAAHVPVQLLILFELTLSQVTVMAEMGTVEQPVNDGADTFKFHAFVVLPPVCTQVTVTELPLGAGLVSGSVVEIAVGFGVAATLDMVTR